MGDMIAVKQSLVYLVLKLALNPVGASRLAPTGFRVSVGFVDFLQLPQPAARACQVDGVTFQALAERQLAEHGQVLVLVVKHVDQIDEALLHGDRTLAELWQVIDDPLVEALHSCR